MRQLRSIGAIGLVAGALGVFGAPAPAAVISSSAANPLRKIWIGKNLQCQVKRTNWVQRAFFPGTGGLAPKGACGTFLATKLTAQTFGPTPMPGAAFPGPTPVPQPYTELYQSPVLTIGKRRCVDTVVEAGPNNNHFHVTQRDCYRKPQTYYTTRIKVVSDNNITRTVGIYHVGDCNVRNSTFGYGAFTAALGAVYCTRLPNNKSTGNALGFIPGNGPSTGFIEDHRNTVWRQLNRAPFFTDTCSCGSSVNNAAGLWWRVTIPAHASVTRKLRTRF